jgi:cytochrome c-type biogenesis protein CcmF
LFSWLLLGIGIGLGAIWAYVVLGWGGYWAWDPVENASLLPWLTGVGLLHSFTVYRRRNGFKGWAIMMAAISFSVVILGTFITRSGLVQSVHAFGEDIFSAWLFGSMIVLPLVFAVWGLIAKREIFASKDDEFESLTSKESSYYFNNVLMLVATIVVSYLTVSSALPAFMPGGGKSFGPDTYDAVAHPVGILYVLIMAVCPLLSWGKTEGVTFWKRAKWPLVGTGVLGAALLTIWYTQLVPIANKVGSSNSFEPLNVQYLYAAFGLLVAALAISVSVFMFTEGARRRSLAKEESFGAALWHIITRARTQSGGYLTHLGIGIILIGLIGSSMYVDDMDFSVPQVAGSSFEAAGYTFNFKGFNEEEVPNGDVESTLAFDVTDGTKLIDTVTPGQIFYFRQQQTRQNVDVMIEPLRDVFVVYNGVDAAGNIQMNVKINPLISFAWVGFVIMIIGASLASWPRKMPEALPVEPAGKNRR